MNKKIKSAKILNIISLILLLICFILYIVFFIDLLINNKNNDNAQGLGFVIIFIVFIIYGSIINGISFILSIISYCLIRKLEYSKKKLYLAYTISIPCLELVEIGLFYLLSLFIK